MQAEQAVKQAQATRGRAAIEVDRVQSLYSAGIDSKRQLEDAETALSLADAALESAKQGVSLLREGPRAEDVSAAELRLQLAQQSLKQAKQNGEAKVLQAGANRVVQPSQLLKFPEDALSADLTGIAKAVGLFLNRQ